MEVLRGFGMFFIWVETMGDVASRSRNGDITVRLSMSHVCQ